jgi:23S rRNA pseudouridine1911/1915/1917 synthase
LHADRHVACINKPSGLLSQPDRTGDPSAVAWSSTLLAGELRLVHRLDRRVSGCLLLARSQRAASRLAKMFRERDVTKHYLAVCQLPRSHGAARATTAGACARVANGDQQLEYRVLVVDQVASLPTALICVSPSGGAKHQIRSLLASADLPIVGDVRYGASRSKAASRGGDDVLALHAATLLLAHPIGGKEPLRIAAPLPTIWRDGAIAAPLLARADQELAHASTSGSVLWDVSPDF